MSISQRVKDLRDVLKTNQIHAYIIPSNDPHQSEYVADHWASRKWISGFTGSAGTAVVTLESAGVWTDSRYFIQAEEELDSTPFTLHKVYNQGSPQYIDWLIEILQKGETVACDGRLFSKKFLDSYQRKLDKHGIKLNTSVDLLSEIWHSRPVLPKTQIFEHKIDYAGESRVSKLKRIREIMSKEGAGLHLISTLDDIAWTFNIRGNDVNFNPVAYAYALIYAEGATIYINPVKVDPVLKDILTLDNIDIKPYDDIWEDLNQLDTADSILIDENNISFSLYRACNCNTKIHRTLPSIEFKAVKNVVEIQHFRNVMIKDGVALVKFFIWLEENISLGIFEYDLVERLAEFRGQQPGYISESFNAIVGYKGNGAIVHYRPAEEGSSKLSGEGLLLVDSGGQYIDGTTDITRTISLGSATDEERDAYTRVLKGHIQLDTAVFPEGTLGVQLDTLARIHLWETGKNFLHGTGHGIGFFLNVHEGPQGFYPGIAARSRVAIDEHMITTNEPGYYEQGKFGIRIENCLLTVKAMSDYRKFETITLFPIATDLIDLSLMNQKEIDWLNTYHRKVFDGLSPHVNEKERAWLKEKCADI